ncbi:hypothetical protein RchiOBHm_Chr5g0048051 [Rosa chinensis]|uniref:Uncharacterized protein n=1 Tax=Rosa chinensis TaxID=74649 RepID=A0A2P6QEI5_ROSCH|nr:hypothetical protein RchiOBHm_Chr5g0048051 [Rosa chinensis]
MVVELYSLSVGEREYILALIQNIFLGTSRASHCFQVRFRVEVSLFCLVQLRKENNQVYILFVFCCCSFFIFLYLFSFLLRFC